MAGTTEEGYDLVTDTTARGRSCEDLSTQDWDQDVSDKR